VVLIPALALIAACALPTASTTGGNPNANPGTNAATPTTVPTATSTPGPTCASLLPSAGPANLGGTFVLPMTFPSGTLGTTPTLVTSGTGLFTIYQLSVCSPAASINAVANFYAAQLPALPHGWIAVTIFPSDGGLMAHCAASCWYNPKGGPLYYMVFDTFVQHASTATTYRLRWAVAPNPPSCNANFTSGPPATQFVYYLPGYTPALPLPPVSSTAPDDSAGTTGIDICGPGTAASVSAFMTKELPATGWSTTTSSKCVFSQCWHNGAAVISWTVTDPTSWVIAWHHF
jgi:hypothetical protein